MIEMFLYVVMHSDSIRVGCHVGFGIDRRGSSIRRGGGVAEEAWFTVVFAEGDKLKLMSVVFFLEGPNYFLETFKYRKRVIKVCSLLPESGVFFIYEGEKTRLYC